MRPRLQTWLFAILLALAGTTGAQETAKPAQPESGDQPAARQAPQRDAAQKAARKRELRRQANVRRAVRRAQLRP